MSDLRDTVVETIEYIDKRLGTIERSPGTWGSPQSLELQTLLLLEVRYVLTRPFLREEKPFTVRLAYIRFIKKHIKNASAEFFAPQLERLGRIEELPRLLAQFRDEITQLPKTKAPSDARPIKTSTLEVASQKPPWHVAAMKESHRNNAPPRMSNVHGGVAR